MTTSSMNHAVGKANKLIEGKKPHERSRILRELWQEAEAHAIRAYLKSGLGKEKP